MKKQVLSVLAFLAILTLAACAPTMTTPLSTPAASPDAATAATPAASTAEPSPVAEKAVVGTATPDTRPAVSAPATDGSRPLADVPAVERNERFSGPAPTYIKPNAIYVATIVTDKGNIVAELYTDTPEGANNFVTLALNGFYDGLTFHRVEAGFVIQGGDPAGDGSGGPGYTIPAEINHGHPRGVLAWARTGDQVNPERRSSGSQFYITIGDASFLDGQYSVFGYVIEGMDVADQIAVGDRIVRVDISEATASLIPTPAPTATPTATPTPYAPTSQEGRPLADLSLEEREGLYNTAPELTLDTTKSYQATIETEKGKIIIDLDPKLAPATVNNFVLLANLGYYDGMPVAYVEPNVYMITGSPASQPSSDVGYILPIEETANASQVITGTVSLYPLADPNGQVAASGSQFFISFIAMEEAATPLNIFGQVTEGMDVVLQLATGDIIKTITINEK